MAVLETVISGNTSVIVTVATPVSSIGLLGYDYTNIQTNARFASEYFNGKLQIHDPNLELNVEGSVDLRNNRNRIQIKGLLDSAYLHNLNLVPTYAILHSEMDIDIQGLVLDSLRGTARLSNIEAHYDDESIELKNITLSAERSKLERQITLNTSLFDAWVNGDFYFSNLFQDLPALIKEFRLNIENDPAAIQNYNSKRGKVPNRYAADFKFNLKNMKSVLDFLDIDVGISQNTLLEGRYSNGPTSNFQAFTKVDSLRYATNNFFKTELEINASKFFDSTNALAMVYVYSRDQSLGNIRTNNLTGEVIWDRSHIDVDLSIAQPETTNLFNLSGVVEFNDSTIIKLLPSTM